MPVDQVETSVDGDRHGQRLLGFDPPAFHLELAEPLVELVVGRLYQAREKLVDHVEIVTYVCSLHSL